MLADEQTQVGELRTEDLAEERRPWEFADEGLEDRQHGDDLDEPPEVGTGVLDPVHAGPVTTISSSVRKLAPGQVAEPLGRQRRGRRRQTLGEALGEPVVVSQRPGATPARTTHPFVTLCAAEAYGTLRRSGRRSATLLGLVATVGIMVTAYAKGPSAIPLMVVLLTVGTMLWYLIGVEQGSPVEGTASTVFVFVWVGVLGSFSALLLAPSQYPDRHGVAFFAGAIIAAVLNDVGALIGGRWFGRHLLAPEVSPKKTWEGLVGGSILTIAGSILITGHIHPWTIPKAALLGVVVAVVAPVGDLCESLVKRDLSLKDMGSLLPGHGGMLDRFDALLFVLPATYYLVRLVHLG